MEKGIVEQPLNALVVHATPALIPNNVEVDISELTVGGTIRVGDLKLPAGVTTETPEDELVVIASLSRAAIEGEEEGAEGEGGEGGGAEAASSGGES
jgi:large subunit ribosomal protein L25